MPPRIRWLYAMLGLVFLILTATPLVRMLLERGDIWWTPATLLVPLPEAADRVRIYVAGEPLTDLIRSGRVRIEQAGALRPILASDVGLRMNNRDRVRVLRMPVMLANAAMLGAVALLLVLVLSGRLRYQPEQEPRSS